MEEYIDGFSKLPKDQAKDLTRIEETISNYTFPDIYSRIVGNDDMINRYLETAKNMGRISPFLTNGVMTYCRDCYNNVSRYFNPNDNFLDKLNQLADQENPTAGDDFDLMVFLNSQPGPLIDSNNLVRNYMMHYPASFLKYLCYELSDQKGENGSLRFMWGINKDTLWKNLPDPRTADNQESNWPINWEY